METWHTALVPETYKKERIGMNSRVFSRIERVPLSTLCKEVKLHPPPPFPSLVKKKQSARKSIGQRDHPWDETIPNTPLHTTYTYIQHIYIYTYTSELNFHLLSQNFLFIIFNFNYNLIHSFKLHN